MSHLKKAFLVFAVSGLTLFGAANQSLTFAAPPDDQGAFEQRRLSSDELKTLAAPVALYPDAILAQVLVACTYPDDVISASQWLKGGNDPQRVDDQHWDLSVRGVARYPGTLDYLANHFDWMNDLGDAFLHQEADVMSAVQILRAEANAAGNLTSTSEQRVIVDSDVIEIVPTDPQVIYIPRYDPDVIFIDRRYDVGRRWDPLISFGPAIRVGEWLHHDVDWHDHAVFYGDWGAYRSWWHADRIREVGHRYADDRPGTHLTVINNTTIVKNRTDIHNDIRPGRWVHDDQKPAPRIAARADAPDRRAGSGYPRTDSSARERSRDIAIPESDAGAGAARASERGRSSRETPHATPAPEARPVPAPRAAPEARPAPQARPAPAPRPAPAARPAPARGDGDRGGAFRGYQNGSSASQSSERGAASRGSSPGHDR